MCVDLVGSYLHDGDDTGETNALPFVLEWIFVKSGDPN